jgi:predicted GNAT superfamily acetyltransferase
VLAILFGFFQGSSYASENYRWFTQKYPRFAYVDRVAVQDSARRLGIASMLYEDFIAGMPADIPVLTCEVNTLPPNPGSLRYHERHGFEIVGHQKTEGGTKEVALLVKDLKAVT